MISSEARHRRPSPTRNPARRSPALVAAIAGALVWLGAPSTRGDDAAQAKKNETSEHREQAVRVAEGLVRITHDGRLKRDPVFWPAPADPDGRRDPEEVVYTVEDPETAQMQLVRRSLSGGEAERFEADGKGRGNRRSDRELSVSRDGSVFAFNTVSGLSSKILVVDNKRNRRTTLPSMGRANWCNWAAVSPDGSTVLFTEAAAVIYAYDLERDAGKESVTRLSPEADESVSDYWPRFSPDGERIVFASNRDDDFEIYVMRRDGSGSRRLTRSPGIDMHPSFSPDGEHIAFTSNRDGNHELYLMRADGTEPRRLTQNPERDEHATWHPDGRRLLFVSEREGDFDLYLLEVFAAEETGEAEVGG